MQNRFKKTKNKNTQRVFVEAISIQLRGDSPPNLLMK